MVSDCCECEDYVIKPANRCAVPPFYGGPGDEYAAALQCGGLNQVNDYIASTPYTDMYPFYDISSAGLCPPPSLCETACWEVPEVLTECNPLP
jgi:hypothetical protein